MGAEHTPGTQGSIDQPIHDMGGGRITSYMGKITQGLRELGGLPSLPDGEERALHRSRSELEAMSSREMMEWQMDTTEWLLSHPEATLDCLIDEDPVSDQF